MTQENVQLPLFEDHDPPLLRVVSRTIRGAQYNLTYLDETIQRSKHRDKHRLSTPALDSWVSKTRASPEHPLHRMAARVGAFPPALARALISRYSKPGDTVLDPFSGKGTAVLEALLLDREAIGTDLAPDAFVLTHAKACPVAIDDALTYVASLPQRRSPAVRHTPANVRLFYADSTLAHLLTVRRQLLNDSLSDDHRIRRLALFTLGALIGILHGPSQFSLSLSCSHYYSQSPSYVRRFIASRPEFGPVHRDVHLCLQTRLEGLRCGSDLPRENGIARQLSAHLLDLTAVLGRRPKLILTSPPYFEVQKYAWDNWLRLWLLGVSNYRDVQSQLLETESVTRYANRIHKCILKFHSLLSDASDARLIMIVGDARFDRTGAVLRRQIGDDLDRYIVDSHINTSEILADIAESVGFEVEEIIDDFVPFGLKGLSSSLAAAKAGGRSDRVYGSDLDRIIILRKARCGIPSVPRVLEIQS